MRITVDDLLKTAEMQKSPIEKHDIADSCNLVEGFYDEGSCLLPTNHE
jgi:hypothetical protein